MELTKDNYSDFIARLRNHNHGEGVEYHCTANPIFIVQSLKRISGIDIDYDPSYFWTDSDGEGEWTEEEFSAELAEFVADCGEHDEFDPNRDRVVERGGEMLFQKIGYHDNWEYECAHLTREAAEAFIKRKSHDHRKLRIYVDSQYWCWEFNSIIGGLLSGKIGLIEGL